MNESELDHFLREYTVHELALLELYGKPVTDHVPALEKMPAAIKDIIDILQHHPERLALMDEDVFIPPGDNIAFIVHPRIGVIPKHRHSFIELIYVYSGQCCQILNDTPVTMRRGDMCILGTRTFHFTSEVGKEDIIINCLMRKSFFDTAFLSRLSGNNLFATFFANTVYKSKNAKEYLVLPSADNERIQQLMIMMLCDYYDKDICSNEIINSYMIILFAEMLRVYKKDINSRHFAALENTKVSDIIRHLEKNYKDVTRESVAKYFHFHPTHLSKILRKLTGTSFTDIVHQVKMNQAGILLKTTDLPISMVANEVGYENMSFFYRIFTKHFRCTPSAYRKKVSLGGIIVMLLLNPVKVMVWMSLS